MVRKQVNEVRNSGELQRKQRPVEERNENETGKSRIEIYVMFCRKSLRRGRKKRVISVGT